MSAPKSFAAAEVHAAIDRLVSGIKERHSGDPAKLLILGIANGGVILARRIAAKIPHAKAGTVDISFHRDDIGRNPIPKEFVPTHIPVDVNGATVVLADDVLFSGRTVKAALDEIFDHGRPTKVELAILVDRGGRRLPVAADYSGLTLQATERQKVIVALDPDDPGKDSIQLRPASPGAASPS